MVSWAKGWRILGSSGTYRFTDYLVAARAAASTENGVIAIRIMWESLEEITTELGELYPDIAGDDLALLEKAFGQLKFIYLFRNNVVAQAISLYRAEKTGYWHTVEGQEPKKHPVFDFDAINSRVKRLEQQNLAWKNWFQKVDINPMVINYEELSTDPARSTEEVLEFLEVELPSYKRLEAPNQRLADETTVSWLEQFAEQLQRRTT